MMTTETKENLQRVEFDADERQRIDGLVSPDSGEDAPHVLSVLAKVNATPPVLEFTAKELYWIAETSEGMLQMAALGAVKSGHPLAGYEEAEILPWAKIWGKALNAMIAFRSNRQNDACKQA